MYTSRTPLRLSVSLAAQAALAGSAALGGPAGDPPSAVSSQYTVELNGHLVHACHEFAAGPAFIRQSEDPRTYVRFLLRLHESPRRHILSRIPRVEVTRLIDDAGHNLLPFSAVEDGRGDDAHRGTPFVFPPTPGSDVQYSDRSLPLDTTVFLRALPSGLSSLHAEVRFEEVTRDLRREFLLPAKSASLELAPGFMFWIGEPPISAPAGATPAKSKYQPGYSNAPGGLSAGYWIDPETHRAAGSPVPQVNFITVTGAGDHTQRLDLQPQRVNGVLVARCNECVPRLANGNLAFDAHLVLATRPVTVPVLLENLRIAGPLADARAAIATTVRTPPRTVRVKHEDYDVRMLQSVCGGGYASASAPALRGLYAAFDLGVRDLTRTRSISRRASWSLSHVLDHEGIPLADPGAVSLTPDYRAADYLLTQFHPAPALPGNPTASEVSTPGTAAMGRLSVPMQSLPGHIGVIRGSVQIQEVVRDMVVTVPLDPDSAPVEPIPGVQVTLERKIDDPGSTIPPEVPYAAVRIHLDQGDPAAGRPRPVLNLIQPIKADGSAGAPISQPSVSKFGDNVTFILTRELWSQSATAVRLHFVLETATRLIPFEFRDIPLSER